MLLSQKPPYTHFIYTIHLNKPLQQLRSPRQRSFVHIHVGVLFKGYITWILYLV